MQQSSGGVSAAPAARQSGGYPSHAAHPLPRVLARLASWLVTLAAAAVAGWLAATLVPQRYTAVTALALAEGRGLAPVGDSPSAAAAIIASPDLAREVVARLGPDAPEIGAASVPPAVMRWLGATGLLPSGAGTAGDVDAYRRALDLDARDAAGVLRIGVAARSAAAAARAANLTAAVYLDRRAAAVTERDAALADAGSAVAAAQQELRRAIDRAAAFRADPGGADTARRAEAANADLSLLVAERAALLAERDAITRRLTSVENLRGSGDLFQAPFEGVSLLRHLVEQRLILRADLAAENRIREARDWRVRALVARAADLDDQIVAATGSVRETLRGEGDHLDRRIAAVEAAIHLRQAIIAAAAGNDRRQNDLDHAVGAARERLALARQRFDDEAQRVRVGAAAARVLAAADVPGRPDPARPAIVGAVAALLAGAAAWTLLGQGRSRPARGAAPPALSGAAAAAPQPQPQPADASTGSGHQAPPQAPAVAAPVAGAGSPLAAMRVHDAGENALDALLERLAIAPRAEGGRHLAVLSAAGDGDGDAVAVAEALAHRLTRDGRIVLLDLTSAGKTPAAGFADLIGGRASFAEIITREPGSRLHRVTRGRGALDPDRVDDTALLALAALDQTYDWIVAAIPAPGDDGLAGRLLERAQGVVLVADGEALDVDGFGAYEALRRRGVDNIVVGLVGASPCPPARPSPSSG